MKTLIKKIRRRLRFNKELKAFKENQKEHKQRFQLKDNDVFRCMEDNTIDTGFDRHYVYHTAWAARALKKNGTKKHIDISSSLYFSSIVSAFIPIDFYDYRPANLVLSDLNSKHADLHNLPWEDNSVESLSCMHTIEHVGLGRYGDPMDYDGDLKAIAELSRVLSKNGKLLIVLPIGNIARIQFNAHRIYTANLVIELFKNEGLQLDEFCLIPENEKDGGLIYSPSEEILKTQKYGCGCFIFTKK